MATPFTDIYSRAVNEFDDPFINESYGDKINFFGILYGYLYNAIPQFTIPTFVSSKLADVSPPTGSEEFFDGDGTTDEFSFTLTPVQDSFFYCEVDGSPVDCEYDYVKGLLKLSVIPQVGVDNVYAKWYYAGSFNQTLTQEESRILSFLLVVNWANKERNHLLDIRRLLNDTDFRLHAESTNMTGKFTWYESLREEAEFMMSDYSWKLFLPKLLDRSGALPW